MCSRSVCVFTWGGCSSRAPQLGGLLCRAVRLCKSMELQTGSWGWGRMAPEGRHVGPEEGLGSDQTRAAAAAAWGTQLDSLGPSYRDRRAVLSA